MKKRILLILLTVIMLVTAIPAYSAESPCFTYDITEQVLAPADSHERALIIAGVYGLELESYAYGIAVLRAAQPKRVVSATRTKAFERVMNSVSEITGTQPVPQLSLNRVYTAMGMTASSELPLQWHHDKIDSYSAWGESTGGGVTIAIIDTGIAANHPDFSGRVLATSYNSHNDTVGITHVADDHGHGTSVAGVAAGRNTGTVSGVAPNADIMVIKANIPDTEEFTSLSLLRGINYAVENGADIINLSLGREYFDENGQSTYEELEHQVVKDAVAKGVTIVAAVGNKKLSNVAYPAAYPEVIAVSSVNRQGEFDSGFSNYGIGVDVAAPGNLIYTTRRTGGYGNSSGTSIATSSVSGTAALIKSLNPKATPEQIAQTIYSTADKNFDGINKSIYFGYGIVNAGKAVELTLANLPTYKVGHVLGKERIGVGDAMEILKHLGRMDSVIQRGNSAWYAALIVSTEKPGVSDAMEIFKKLARMDNVLDRI